LHNGKLGQSGKQEKSFASGRESIVTRKSPARRSPATAGRRRVLLALFRPPKKINFFVDIRSGFLGKTLLGAGFAKGQAKQTPTMNGRKMSSPGRNQEGQNNQKKKEN
jgi:hypothetical protein